MSVYSNGPLAIDVTETAIAAHLVGRAPLLLQDQAMRDAIKELTTGIVIEVTRITGDPPPDSLRPLAVWAVTLGVAASLESSLHPEQQLGDEGRASDLRVKYLAALADLRSDPEAATRRRRPRASYPPPQAWPDPAQSGAFGYGRGWC